MENSRFLFRAWDRRWKTMSYGGGDVLLRRNSDHEIMQFTGLKDRNGKEIYDSDLLRHPDTDYIHRVKFGGLLEDRHNSCYGYSFPYHLNLNKLEIIGNVYQNPDLLEPKGLE